MRHFLIDGFNLAYRAHNANFELKNASGLPSGMIYGFVRTVLALKKKYRGYKFAVVWDKYSQEKRDIQPDYKAGRTSLASTVSAQVPDIKACMQYMGMEQYEKEGYEADDIIATLAQSHVKDGSEHVIIYSNDKDFLQLVSTKVTVFKPKVGNSPEKFYDEEAVRDLFGVPPHKLACFRSFDGDASDNITGVSRVPRKVLASMVDRFETIEGVYRWLGEEKLTEYQRGAILEAKERVTNNYKLIKLQTVPDVPCNPGTPDAKQASEVLSKYDIKSIKPEDAIDLLGSSLNIRYTEPPPKLQTISLFE